MVVADICQQNGGIILGKSLEKNSTVQALTYDFKEAQGLMLSDQLQALKL